MFLSSAAWPEMFQGKVLIPSCQWKDEGYGAAYQYFLLRPEIAVYVGDVSMVIAVQF